MEKYRDKKNRNKEFWSFIEPYVSDKSFDSIKSCGNFLEFYADSTLEHKKLKQGYFCKNRFCPYCNRRKSRRRALELSVVMKYLDLEGYAFIFLTLTAPNVKSEDLKFELEHYSRSFERLIKRTDVKKCIKGYARKLEITYNKRRDDYHPHYHVILVVKPSYFTDSRVYLSRERWLDLWRESARNSNITQIDVRKLNLENKSTIFEVSKYSAKDSDYLINDSVFDTFYNSLRGKRDIAFGGVFKDAVSKFKSGHLDYLKEVDPIQYIYLLRYLWEFDDYTEILKKELTEDEKKKVNNLPLEEEDLN